MALCCAAEHAMIYQLMCNPELDEVIICTDYDKAGIDAYYRPEEIPGNYGYFDVRQELTEYKHWHEDLKALNGEVTISSEEHPQLTHMQELCDQLSRYCKNERCPKNARRRLLDGYNRLVSLINNGQKFNVYADEIQEQSFEYASCAFLQAQEMYNQIGKPITAEKLGEQMIGLYQPHKDKNLLTGKLNDTKID